MLPRLPQDLIDACCDAMALHSIVQLSMTNARMRAQTHHAARRAKRDLIQAIAPQIRRSAMATIQPNADGVTLACERFSIFDESACLATELPVRVCQRFPKSGRLFNEVKRHQVRQSRDAVVQTIEFKSSVLVELHGRFIDALGMFARWHCVLVRVSE